MYTEEEMTYLMKELDSSIRDPFYSLCSTSIITSGISNKDKFPMVLQKLIRFLVQGRKRKNLNRIVFSTSLEDMPLYINDQGYKGCFARWRLKIGK